MQERFGSVMVGSVLLIVGSLFVWQGIPHTASVTCQRAAAASVNCQQQARIFWWIPIQTASFSQIQSVHLREGENAYDSMVYWLELRGAAHSLKFGNTLDFAEIQLDLVRTQQFLEQSQRQPLPSELKLERYTVDWTFVIVGLPIAALGCWSLIYRPE